MIGLIVFLGTLTLGLAMFLVLKIVLKDVENAVKDEPDWEGRNG